LRIWPATNAPINDTRYAVLIPRCQAASRSRRAAAASASSGALCAGGGAALELGFYISVSGIATFKKADVLRATLKEVPLNRLLVETDAPYLAPEPLRGRSNEPAFVANTAARLAAVRALSEAEMAHATTENFFRLFRKVPRSVLKAPLTAA